MKNVSYFRSYDKLIRTLSFKELVKSLNFIQVNVIQKTRKIVKFYPGECWLEQYGNLPS